MERVNMGPGNSQTDPGFDRSPESPLAAVLFFSEKIRNLPAYLQWRTLLQETAKALAASPAKG